MKKLLILAAVVGITQLQAINYKDYAKGSRIVRVGEIYKIFTGLLGARDVALKGTVCLPAQSQKKKWAELIKISDELIMKEYSSIKKDPSPFSKNRRLNQEVRHYLVRNLEKRFPYPCE